MSHKQFKSPGIEKLHRELILRMKIYSWKEKEEKREDLKNSKTQLTSSGFS